MVPSLFEPLKRYCMYVFHFSYVLIPESPPILERAADSSYLSHFVY